MSPVFQGLLLVGDLVFLILIFVMVKNGRLSVRFSLPWLGLGAGMLVLAVWPEVAKILRSLVQVEVVSNMVFIMLFCFVLLVLLILCAVVSEYNERLKRRALVQARTTPRPEGGYTVTLSLSDELDNLMKLELLVTREDMAKTLQDHFRAEAERIYSRILAVLFETEDSRERRDGGASPT